LTFKKVKAENMVMFVTEPSAPTEPNFASLLMMGIPNLNGKRIIYQFSIYFSERILSKACKPPYF